MRSVNSIISAARREALASVTAQLRAVLPKGWRVYFAVGWGLTAYNDKGETIVGTYEDAPPRLPRGVRGALRTAAAFCDTFGYGNEIIDARRR